MLDHNRVRNQIADALALFGTQHAHHSRQDGQQQRRVEPHQQFAQQCARKAARSERGSHGANAAQPLAGRHAIAALVTNHDEEWRNSEVRHTERQQGQFRPVMGKLSLKKSKPRPVQRL